MIGLLVLLFILILVWGLFVEPSPPKGCCLHEGKRECREFRKVLPRGKRQIKFRAWFR